MRCTGDTGLEGAEGKEKWGKRHGEVGTTHGPPEVKEGRRGRGGGPPRTVGKQRALQPLAGWLTACLTACLPGWLPDRLPA